MDFESFYIMKNTLNIATHHYFPFHFIALGFALIPLIVIPIYPILSIVLLPIALMLTTTHYRLRIDTERKVYKEYLWFLGFENGKEVHYKNIDHIYINKLNISSEYGYVARVHASAPVYRGYLKISDHEKLFITEHRKEKKVAARLQKVAEYINTSIHNNY